MTDLAETIEAALPQPGKRGHTKDQGSDEAVADCALFLFWTLAGVDEFFCREL